MVLVACVASLWLDRADPHRRANTLTSYSMQPSHLCALVLSIACVWMQSVRAADLTRAVVVTPENLAAQETKAVGMLADEVHKRTGIRWDVVHQWPQGD